MAGAVALVALTNVAVAASTHVVAMDGVSYAPATLTVKRGDTIVWRNKDPYPHTVTAKGAFDSGSIAAGKEWKFVYPGKYINNAKTSEARNALGQLSKDAAGAYVRETMAGSVLALGSTALLQRITAGQPGSR